MRRWVGVGGKRAVVRFCLSIKAAVNGWEVESARLCLPSPWSRWICGDSRGAVHLHIGKTLSIFIYLITLYVLTVPFEDCGVCISL